MLILKSETPLGPTERKWPGSKKVHSFLNCGICGKFHDKQDGGHDVFKIGINTIVLECCGAALDSLYEKFGQIFIDFLLEEKKTEREFEWLIERIKNCLDSVRSNLPGNAAQMKAMEASEALDLVLDFIAKSQTD